MSGRRVLALACALLAVGAAFADKTSSCVMFAVAALSFAIADALAGAE